jgi:hypothetical protein
MSVLHQPADDVAAHPSQADHAKLHLDKVLSFERDPIRKPVPLFGIML